MSHSSITSNIHVSKMAIGINLKQLLIVSIPLVLEVILFSHFKVLGNHTTENLEM